MGVDIAKHVFEFMAGMLKPESFCGSVSDPSGSLHSSPTCRDTSLVLKACCSAKDDAAICETVSRLHVLWGSAKSLEQQDIQALHGVRRSLMSSRRGRSNKICGLLTGHGIVFPEHIGQLRRGVPMILEDATSELTPSCLRLFVALVIARGEVQRWPA